MASADSVVALAVYAKSDSTFMPLKDPGTTRWYGHVGGGDFELLLTGPKFFDTRAQKGGGGAVDLAMHLFQVDFKAAVDLLRQKGI